jgi:hypothetical protein
MPFIDMAQIMKERYGHVVRIASHGDLRAPIEKAGLRFYPLGGNAQQMAGWGPSFSLKPAILLKLAANPNTVHKLVVMRAVSTSCINACTMPDPADAQAEPFHADVVMANPMCLGHIHCAEGLGVPLHLFFPNPWVATTEYPHSFSGWDYPHKLRADPADGVGYDWVRKSANYYSYRFVDGVLWHVFLSSINELRAVCRLRTLRFGTFTSGTSACRPTTPHIPHPPRAPWSMCLNPRTPPYTHAVRDRAALRFRRRCLLPLPLPPLTRLVRTCASCNCPPRQSYTTTRSHSHSCGAPRSARARTTGRRTPRSAAFSSGTSALGTWTRPRRSSHPSSNGSTPASRPSTLVLARWSSTGSSACSPE